MSQAESDSMVHKAEQLVLKANPTRPRRGQERSRNYCSIMRSTLNEEKLMNRLESGDKEKIEATIEIDSLFEGTSYS